MSEELAGPHIHTCSCCTHQWGCVKKNCEIEKAAKINGGGVMCALCYHLEMARRYADHRGVKLKIKLLPK